MFSKLVSSVLGIPCLKSFLAIIIVKKTGIFVFSTRENTVNCPEICGKDPFKKSKNLCLVSLICVTYVPFHKLQVELEHSFKFFNV